MEEEREVVHKLFISTMDPAYGGFQPSNMGAVSPPSDPNIRFMKDTRLNTLLLCHPQVSHSFHAILHTDTNYLAIVSHFKSIFSNYSIEIDTIKFLEVSSCVKLMS